MELVLEIYSCTESFPKSEIYGLVSQLRRAAVSVPSNIAEGHARQSTGEFKQFLGHALGSLMEMETQITIGERRGYIDSDQVKNLIGRTEEVGKIVNGLLRSLARK
jgi:four helix bundle protein